MVAAVRVVLADVVEVVCVRVYADAGDNDVNFSCFHCGCSGYYGAPVWLHVSKNDEF